MSQTVDPIVNAREVELVDDDYPTDKREMVAEYIDEHWNEQGGMSLTKISDETGTSRQHVKNTLEAHFRVVDGPRNGGRAAVPERDGVDPELLEIVLKAYRMGIRDMRDDERDQGITDELLELAQRK